MRESRKEWSVLVVPPHDERQDIGTEERAAWEQVIEKIGFYTKLYETKEQAEDEARRALRAIKDLNKSIEFVAYYFRIYSTRPGGVKGEGELPCISSHDG